MIYGPRYDWNNPLRPLPKDFETDVASYLLMQRVLNVSVKTRHGLVRPKNAYGSIQEAIDEMPLRKQQLDELNDVINDLEEKIESLGCRIRDTIPVISCWIKISDPLGEGDMYAARTGADGETLHIIPADHLKIYTFPDGFSVTPEEYFEGQK